MEPKLSIVVAVKDGTSNLPALLGALKERDGNTEVILCCAGPATCNEDVAQLFFPAETLVPALWSEGILRARGSRVALTTAQFVPACDWLERLQAADLRRWVGVGGAIDNDPAASARNWAIFFLRYSAFAPPLPAGETDEIAADNAVYDRAAILEHADLLREGFWEPSFHRRFRNAGKKLALDPDLVVVHHGTVSAQNFARQRYLHGRAYGIERAERAGFTRNLLLLLSSPARSSAAAGTNLHQDRPRGRAIAPGFWWHCRGLSASPSPGQSAKPAATLQPCSRRARLLRRFLKRHA